MENFEPKLQWRGHTEDFNSNERRVLLALSNKRWWWRNMESLQRVTRLEQDDLTVSLKNLMEDGYSSAWSLSKTLCSLAISFFISCWRRFT